jgi:hypothetical protein
MCGLLLQYLCNNRLKVIIIVSLRPVNLANKGHGLQCVESMHKNNLATQWSDEYPLDLIHVRYAANSIRNSVVVIACSATLIPNC